MWSGSKITTIGNRRNIKKNIREKNDKLIATDSQSAFISMKKRGNYRKMNAKYCKSLEEITTTQED